VKLSLLALCLLENKDANLPFQVFFPLSAFFLSIFFWEVFFPVTPDCIWFCLDWGFNTYHSFLYLFIFQTSSNLWDWFTLLFTNFVFVWWSFQLSDWLEESAKVWLVLSFFSILFRKSLSFEWMRLFFLPKPSLEHLFLATHL
jgi:hypothetical protein